MVFSDIQCKIPQDDQLTERLNVAIIKSFWRLLFASYINKKPYVLYKYYVHLTSVGFEHSAWHESPLSSYIVLLAWLVEHFLIYWYQQYVNVHQVLKYICIYIQYILKNYIVLHMWNLYLFCIYLWHIPLYIYK